MTPDQERWAEALAVERIHGGAAEMHVVGRILELTLAGDEAGCARWRAIGERLERLRLG